MKGIIQKTEKHSFFVRFHVNSNFSEKVFGEGSRYVVLQIMELADLELIAELILREDVDHE